MVYKSQYNDLGIYKNVSNTNCSFYELDNISEKYNNCLNSSLKFCEFVESEYCVPTSEKICNKITEFASDHALTKTYVVADKNKSCEDIGGTIPTKEECKEATNGYYKGSDKI